MNGHADLIIEKVLKLVWTFWIDILGLRKVGPVLQKILDNCQNLYFKILKIDLQVLANYLLCIYLLWALFS